MSSRTWSSGSDPWTSTRSLAGPADISSDSCRVGVMRSFGSGRSTTAAGSSSGQRRAMSSRTSSKCPWRASTTAVAVAALERREDRGVEVGRPLRVRAGDHERDVGPRERLERAPDLLERAVVRELDDPPVEAGVSLGQASTVVVASRRAHRLETAGELGQIGVGRSGGRPAARRAPRGSTERRRPR